MHEEYEKRANLLENSSGEKLECVQDYQRVAERRLTSELKSYIYGATETETTLQRNLEAFSQYALRRRVLQGANSLDCKISYFEGRMESDLPFFPSCINVARMYPRALMDVFAVTKKFRTPIFVSNLAIVDPLELSRLPALISEGSCLIWQLYLEKNKIELLFKQAQQIEKWGYSGLTLTVDTGVPIKLGNSRSQFSHEILQPTLEDLGRLRKSTALPLIVKGVMTAEDAELAIEHGADGVVVSNHGGRMLDYADASLDALPQIVQHLRSKRKTRKAEIFFDGGIRRGADILISLALGARGCLIGRPIFWALAVDRNDGVPSVMSILKKELERAAILAGVRQLSQVDRSILRREDRLN